MSKDKDNPKINSFHWDIKCGKGILRYWVKDVREYDFYYKSGTHFLLQFYIDLVWSLFLKEKRQLWCLSFKEMQNFLEKCKILFIC